jgi:transcription-repair coupling factor (superfamily II helicase)
MKLLTQYSPGYRISPPAGSSRLGGLSAAVSACPRPPSHFAAGSGADGPPGGAAVRRRNRADRLAEDLTAFTGQAVRRLSARDFTFHNAAVVSRQWGAPAAFGAAALAAGSLPDGVYGGIPAPAHPAPHPADPVRPDAAGGGVPRSARAGRAARAGGYTRASRWRAWAVCPAGRILDVFSPAFDRPCGRSSSGMRSTPWACSMCPASGGR